MDAVRTVVDFALVAGSRLHASGTMDAVDAMDTMDAGSASVFWDGEAGEFDEAPDHGLQDPAVRDAWVDRSWWRVVADPSVDRG